MRARTIAVSATGAVCTLAFAGLVGPPAAAEDPVPIEDLVTGAAVMEHLEAFQDIADAHGGNRALETPGYEAAAVYVEQVLTAAGYTPERQYFTFEEEVVDEYELTVPGVEIDLIGYPAAFAPDTPAGGVTGPLVEPADELRHGCDATAWDGVDADAAVALVSRGTCPFADKVAAAAGAGASAVVLYNNAAGVLNPTLGAENDAWVPTVGLTQEQGQAILAVLAEGPVDATYVLQTSLQTFETFNVLAETPTGRADNVVMVGAHLDSVEDGPGINDNGSGSAAILETAVRLAETGDLENQVRFAWWGAEEVGLIGSWHYVEDLVENDPAALDDIATYLNFDMVGSPNYVIGVYDADESTYPAPVPVPDGSVETESVFTDYFDSIDQPWVDTEFSGRSDYQAFITNGIPASGLFTGADGSKTAEEVALFGGTEGVFYDPNYHSPADTIENVDPTALDIMSKAIAYATASLAEDTFAVNGVGSPRIDDVRATTRCLAGTAYVALTGANGEAAPTDVRLVTPFGDKKFDALAPGRNAYQSFTTRSSSVEAGTATVIAYQWRNGDPVYQRYEVPYEATSCN
ncbi:M20/M25/M40 family metallo-hydrolase [Oerskovia flava]|uniref:M20/M25/M40 family metallo-hydrolase n=1 Tax=Oerskovia flava TaxID=2986422 RepID=UPI00223F17D8|nr:M20/M25/M40 family metallo-hydrolase [Oerskovia sp. JB1-3-2]